jgi:hypothetical protein
VLAFVPLLFFLIQSVIRGVEDQVTLGRIVVAAAICKACLAVYVRKVVAPGLPHELPYATSHDDSMIFAVASVILMARLNERFDRRASVACAAFLPLLAAGMIANERRIVWVDIAFGMLAVAMVSRWTPFKLFITRVAVISIPFVALYFVIGWNSSSRLFAPVRTVHTMVSGDEDSSTGTRDIENFNLIWTLKDHPLLGTGFGHEYVEKVVGDDISKFVAQYRYIPHNSVLGFWAFCGFVGFTGIWMLLVLGVFFAARAYRHARSAETRAAAASCIATVLIVVLQAYGDMALVSWTSAFLLAPALALAGKLAVATGAWKVAPRPLPPHEAALAVVRAPRLEAVP